MQASGLCCCPFYGGGSVVVELLYSVAPIVCGGSVFGPPFIISVLCVYLVFQES